MVVLSFVMSPSAAIPVIPLSGYLAYLSQTEGLITHFLKIEEKQKK